MTRDEIAKARKKGLQEYGLSKAERAALKNADTRFTYCATCDEMIADHRAEEHRKEGHKVEAVKNADRPPTESEIREYHAKNHSGKFIECKQCEAIIMGDAKMKNEQKKCEQCGKAFDAHSPKEKYCSKECWKESGGKI